MREIVDRTLEPRRRVREQKLPRLRRRLAQRHGGDLDGLAGDRRALVGRARGVAEHHDDARNGHVEFLGDDLRERGADAGAEIDMAVEGGDAAIRRDRDERLVSACVPPGRTTTICPAAGSRRAESSIAAISRLTSAAWPRGPHRRAHDLDMRAAAAQIVAQGFANLGFGRDGGPRQQRLGAS